MKSQTSGKGEAKPKENFPTKIVIRRLPPTLTSDGFLDEVSPIPEHNYYHYVSADKALGSSAFCRAVINFKNLEDVIVFKEKFDDYVFVDSKGHEYPAIVEFAPYQKVPVLSRKPDRRENTLEEDIDFKKFKESLENPEPNPSVSIKEVLEEVEAKAREKQAAQNAETPLIAFINKFKLEKKRMQDKIREERRQKDLERRRQRDEERRIKREKERKAKESSKGDGKKSGGKEEGKPSSGKESTKTQSKSAQGKSEDKGGKSKQPKDDGIIVRTLPSRSKYDKSKGKPGTKPGSASQGKTTTNKDDHRATEDTKSKTEGSEGKEKITVREKPNPSNVLSRPSEVDRLSESISDISLSEKSTHNKRQHKQSDRGKKADQGERDDDTERPSSGEADKGKAARSTRYKERPEIARYNPGARAAERKYKQHKPSASEDGDSKASSANE